MARIRERAAPARRARDRAVLAIEPGRRQLEVPRVHDQLRAALARPVLDQPPPDRERVDGLDLGPPRLRAELARGPVDAPTGNPDGPVLRVRRVAEGPAPGSAGASLAAAGEVQQAARDAAVAQP